MPLCVVPRIWLPAVACPNCSYPNDHAFRFCQQCGYAHRCGLTAQPETLLHVDLPSVDARITQLFDRESVYDRQKSRLSDLLLQFLRSLPVPKDLMSATPLDLVCFLVWKDKTGTTQVHSMSCPHQGLKGSFSCECTFRLAAGTVDSLIGNLRTIFKANDCVGDWEGGFGLGNPAASLLVSKYLKCVKEEQAAAGVVPQQAIPLFVDKLARLADHMDSRLVACQDDPLQTYILARDQAFFKTLFFLEDRLGDLAHVRTNEILCFPNDDGLLFNHTWGKTLRGGNLYLFGIRRCSNTRICPVAIEGYISTSRVMQIDLSQGCLFRLTTAQGTITDLSVSSEAMNCRLKTYLREAGLDEREMAHSYLGPFWICVGRCYESCWVGTRPHSVLLYAIGEGSLHDSTSALMAAAVDDPEPVTALTKLYQDLNAVKDFVLAFPSL
ncbi:LIGHT-DEPENDENT SHORT HYPOCOTYLS 6 [Paramuricea clavata]|uniref:LIGHT-DEPENDENT SHORT HYPOCOTYLS 6 n=1 Tax=Paramuricea clavata TaxID=317549 RepID=A0A6S7G6M9_PARCT|nr:LIGHT-DEPENDENT SHORT HYPOCOTYLS 6 [Paramuricea clavata]